MRDRSDHKSPERRVKEKRDLERILRDDAPAALVVNTRSRHGGRLYARARELLLEKEIRLGATYPVRDPVRLPEVVPEVIGRGYKLVIVGGGDGTISSVVDDFAYKEGGKDSGKKHTDRRIKPRLVIMKAPGAVPMAPAFGWD